MSPKHPYTQALIDAISEPNPENVDKEKKIRILEPTEIKDIVGCNFKARCHYAIEKCNTEPELEEIENMHHPACFVKLD